MALSSFSVSTSADSSNTHIHVVEILPLYVFELTKPLTRHISIPRNAHTINLRSVNDHDCHRDACPSLRVFEFVSTPVPSSAKQGKALIVVAEMQL